MNWNPFKRLFDLEKKVAALDSDMSYVLQRFRNLADRLAESEAFVRAFASAAVSDNAAATAKRKEYNKTYHAKKAAEKYAKEGIAMQNELAGIAGAQKAWAMASTANPPSFAIIPPGVPLWHSATNPYAPTLSPELVAGLDARDKAQKRASDKKERVDAAARHATIHYKG